MWFEPRILSAILNKSDIYIYIYINIRVDIYILRLEIQMNIDYNINGESPENLNN